MVEIAKVCALIAVLAFVAFWGWLRFRRDSAQSRLLFEAQKQLFDKLGSTSDVSQFLASPEGKEFLDRLKPPAPPPTPEGPSPAEVLFLMVWVGVILIGVGAGFLVGAIWLDPRFFLPAAIVGLAGVGVLVGLMITHALAKRWGLVKFNADGQIFDARKPLK